MKLSKHLVKPLKKGILIRVIFFLVCFIDFKQGSTVLQISFGVLGILYSIAVSTAVSIDLSKVSNNRYRRQFKESLYNIVSSLTIDLLLTSLLIVLGLLLEPIRIPIRGINLYLSYATWGILFSLRSLFFEALSFMHLLQFKDDLAEQIIKEENHSK
jgi:hypothetical protein